MMPPPPGRSVGYPLLIALDAPMVATAVATIAALVMLASALVARRTVSKPVVDALGHV